MSQQTTERAWQTFARTLPQGTKNCTTEREDICGFVGVNQHTVRRWITADSVSGVRGLTVVKLRCFLELQGYEIAELRSLNRLIRTFAEILGHSVVSLEDTCREIEGEVSQRAIDRIYDLILGRTQTALEPKMRIIQAFVDTHKDKLNEKKRGLVTNRSDEVPVITTEQQPAQEKRDSGVTQSREREHTVIRQLVISLVPAFRRVIELVVSDEFSSQDRRNIRELVGDDLFKLSTAMNRLSSETGRIQYDSKHSPRRG